MHAKKAVKRTVKLLVNLIALFLSTVLLVLVAATQDGYELTANASGGAVLSRAVECKLNVGAYGVCAYAYVLGGLGTVIALLVVLMTLVSCVTDADAPVILDATFHAIALIWWIIGVAVLGTFVARANAKSPGVQHAPGHVSASESAGARVAIVLVALGNTLLYVYFCFVSRRIANQNFVRYLFSLWSNLCCCIARHKHETVSMYV